MTASRTSATPIEHPGRRRPEPIALAALALVAALAVAIRARSYDVPLGCDTSFYAVLGSELLHGRRLYTDLFDHKPPLLYLAFALASAVAGDGRPAVFLVGAACLVAGVVAAGLAGRAGSGSWRIGVLAALFWTLTASDVGLESNQPNAEALLVPCHALAVALFLGPRTARRALFAGAAIAAATLVKHVSIVVLAGLAAAHVVTAPPGERREAALEGARALGVVVAAWLLVIGWFGATARLGDFWASVITYNRAYAGALSENLVTGAAENDRVLPKLLFMAPLAVLYATGLAADLVRRRDRRRWVVLVAATLATWAAVTLPGRGFPHYHQLWTPVAAIGAALGADALRRSRAGRPLATAAAALVLACLAVHEARWHRLSPAERTQLQFGTHTVAASELGRAAGALLAPGERLYEWGFDPQVYVESHTRPVGGVFFSKHLSDAPHAARLSAGLLADLRRTPPELVIFHKCAPLKTGDPVVTWLEQNYRVAEDPRLGAPGFVIAVRNGGRLDGVLGKPRSGG